jgi:protein gp37
MPSSIEWTDETWNFLLGCSRVSEGCRHCYAERESYRKQFSPNEKIRDAYLGLTRKTAGGIKFTGNVRFLPSRLAAPLRWRTPKRVFVNSMSDVFHEKVSFHAIAAGFGVMAAATTHTFQILTKRSERAEEFFAWAADGGAHALLGPSGPIDVMRSAASDALLGDTAYSKRDCDRFVAAISGCPTVWPLPNVQLYVSVEDQKTFDERVTSLLRCPAWTRGISYEPALGPIDMSSAMPVDTFAEHVRPPDDTVQTVLQFRRRWAAACGQVGTGSLDSVIIGGESGPGARPFDVCWMQETVAACARASVPVFCKQLGAWPYDGNEWNRGPEALLNLRLRVPAEGGGKTKERPWLNLASRKGADTSEWPESLRVQQLPMAISAKETRLLASALAAAKEAA